jgi:hypothetical protein
MSFSFSAAGTRDETVKSLRKLTVDDSLGAGVRDLIASGLELATDKGGAESLPVRYEVSAYGHSAGGDIFNLSVQVTGQPVTG